MNAENYLTKPAPSVNEFYYKEDSYAVNVKMGVSDQKPKAPIRRFSAKVKEIKVGTMGITIERITMFEITTTTVTTTSTGINMITKIIGVDPMFHRKIWKLLLWMVKVVY